MPIIISALHFPWETMAECLRVARDELGLDGVELSLAASFARPHCTREDLDILRAQRTDLLLDAHIWENLAVMGLEAGAAALLGWLEVCRETGIGGLVIHGGSYPDHEAGIARTVDALAPVLPAFADAGVVLKLENHYAFDYHDCRELFSEPWEFDQLFAALPNSALRCCFDTGHGHMTRNWDPLLRAMAPRLVHVHLADNHGIDDDHCAYGDGTVPFAAMFDLLQALDYPGPFCVEFPVREDRHPFHACVAELRRRGW
jgi:sugar phosphate isomerase/epimerase